MLMMRRDAPSLNVSFFVQGYGNSLRYCLVRMGVLSYRTYGPSTDGCRLFYQRAIAANPPVLY